MTDLTHLIADVRLVAMLDVEQRLQELDKPRWIGYPKAKELLTEMQGLLTKHERPRMPNLLIVGDSNNGKTTLIERFRELCGEPYVDEGGDPVKPVIVAQAPPKPDEKELYMAILERFWTPYRPTDSTAKLRYQLIHLMRLCRVRMLVIDEMHSMLAGPAIKQREVMNALKLLCNELRVPVVGVGTREAVQILHTDPQHASRFDVATLPIWECNPAFQGLLSSFEKILPLRSPSQLSRPELAAKLHAISGGNIGNLHRLLNACAATALKTGVECIDVQIIETHQWIRPTRGIRERFA
jgi:hypothetical protein